MKRFIIPLLIIIFIALTAYKIGFKNIFVPSSVRKVRQSEEKLLREATEATEAAGTDKVKIYKAGKKWEALGRYYLRKKRLRKAAQAYEKSISMGNDDARVYYSLAVAQANLGKSTKDEDSYTKAAQNYKNAYAINKELYDAPYGLSIIYFYTLNRQQDAIGLMKDLVTKAPKYFKGRFALARYYYETGEKELSLGEYEKLYELLRKEDDSPVIKEYRQNCRTNITRLMTEIGR
jgi:tetratricopeptide (TPR) repeat protein